MLRIQAARSILLDEVAGLRSDDSATGGSIAALGKAQRRAKLVAALDWVAIAVLFLLRQSGSAFLELGPTEQGLFSIGILAVATHAGFRLGQLEKYNAVQRSIEQLPAEAAVATAQTGDA